MSIFGDDVIEEYRGSELFQNPPHPFSIADAAYQLVTKTMDSHCIVASGESGSGKYCYILYSVFLLCNGESGMKYTVGMNTVIYG